MWGGGGGAAFFMGFAWGEAASTMQGVRLIFCGAAS